MKIHAKRLLPEQDLKSEIAHLCEAKEIRAGIILSAVGSLKQLSLRLAGTSEFLNRHDLFEIVSLTGTCSSNGIHLHMSVADKTGKVWGGHLVDKNIIYTTCELVIADLEDIAFKREFDQKTGFKELKIDSI